MGQKMYLPLDEAVVNVGYKSEKYHEQYNQVQYGTDLSMSSRMVYCACKEGEIERIFDNGVEGDLYCVVRYDDVECLDGVERTIWVKYGHLKRCQLSEGYIVEESEMLGSFEGGYLHVEMCLEQPDYENDIMFNDERRTKDTTIAPYMVWQTRKEENIDEGLYKQTITTEEQWLENGWVSEWDILDFSNGEPSIEPEEKPEPEEPDEPVDPDEPDVPDVPDVPDLPDIPDIPDIPDDDEDDSVWETRYKCLVYDLCVLVKKYLK